MASHQELAQRLKIRVYFADPQSPWQRPTNENTNGLIREYLPKGMDLSNVSPRRSTRARENASTFRHRKKPWRNKTNTYNRALHFRLETAKG